VDEIMHIGEKDSLETLLVREVDLLFCPVRVITWETPSRAVHLLDFAIVRAFFEKLIVVFEHLEVIWACIVSEIGIAQKERKQVVELALEIGHALREFHVQIAFASCFYGRIRIPCNHTIARRLWRLAINYPVPDPATSQDRERQDAAKHDG
jgi:hypothetical protein